MTAALPSMLRRVGGIGLVVALIVGAGLVALAVDVVTDDSPSMSGDVYERIDAYVEDELDDSRIPGAALAIVDNGATVHVAGFGDDGRGNAVTPNTPFWIGSNTKSITALAIMQLAENGSLDLDAPVQRYLPEFDLADADAASAMTVRHLLNQTSGISRTDGIRAVVAGRDQTMLDTVADMADLELERAVGETFEYANLNSVVLGAIVETVTGRAWEDYVDEHIFAPLDMDRTFADKDLAEAAGLTATHRSFFGLPIETNGEHLDGLMASGYVYSTADDMARYLAMYTNGGQLADERLLSSDGIDEMLTPATDERTFPLQSQTFAARYGAGWFVGPFGSAQDARWHQGSLPHFTAWMVLLPESDQAVVVMLNAGNQFDIGGANSAWSRIPQGIVDLLRGEAPPAGTGSTRFFIVFTAIVAAVVAAQAVTLARLVRNGLGSARSTRRNVGPLIWELGFGGLVLLAYPSVVGGFGWSTAFSFVPDLTLTVLVISGLAVTTGAARTALLFQRRRAGASGRNVPTATTQPSNPSTTERNP